MTSVPPGPFAHPLHRDLALRPPLHQGRRPAPAAPLWLPLLSPAPPRLAFHPQSTCPAAEVLPFSSPSPRVSVSLPGVTAVDSPLLLQSLSLSRSAVLSWANHNLVKPSGPSPCPPRGAVWLGRAVSPAGWSPRHRRRRPKQALPCRLQSTGPGPCPLSEFQRPAPPSEAEEHLAVSPRRLRVCVCASICAPACVCCLPPLGRLGPAPALRDVAERFGLWPTPRPPVCPHGGCSCRRE